MTAPASEARASGYIKLALIVVCGVAIWGSLLPRIAQAPAVRQWIEPLRAQGIDPSALYYTDVFILPPKQ